MFHSARIKLTAWYLLILMCISISFSATIYRVLTHEVERFARAQRYRIEHRLDDGVFIPSDLPLTDPDLVNETTERILWSLILLNGIIMIASGGLSYILAGRTLDPIKTMVDEQNQFVSDASHELRTPLTSLKSAIEVNLRDKNLTLSQAKQIMTENIQEVNNLQALTDHLLQIAQFQTPHNTQQFEPINIEVLVGEAIHKILPIAKAKHITITSNLQSGGIKGNKHTLTDLVIILLDNAIKYSKKKKIVHVKTWSHGGQVVISINDQGMGISKKDLPHVYDRFYRADMARNKSQTTGYGLGLAIAKQIVAIHNGTIDIQSASNQGTTATVTFPTTT